ncbi:MAG: DUF6580 family putative transport protein [Patescibacteria group bacterium]|jgi:hypothetical protein
MKKIQPFNLKGILRTSWLPAVLIALGIASRVLMHDWSRLPNVELVTGLSLLAGYYLRGWRSAIVPLAIMFGSDMLIGNTNIFLFTWTAYLLAVGGGWILRQPKLSRHIVWTGLGAGMLFSLFFYLYTNFGVWMITPWYQQNASGLLYAYYMGLPFLKLNLAGNLVLVPLCFTVAEMARRGWRMAKPTAKAVRP